MEAKQLEKKMEQIERLKQKNKSFREVLRKIALHVGFTDDSTEDVTPSIVEKRVKEIVDRADRVAALEAELAATKAKLAPLEQENMNLKDNQFALPGSKKRKDPDNDGYVEFDMQTHANAVRKYGVDHPITKAIEQSFSWSPRLAALLGNPALNQAFQDMEFDFPTGTGIEGNEEFKCSDGTAFTVVGYLPSRPVNCIAAIRSNVLYGEDRNLVPTDLHSFGVSAITRSIGGPEQLKQLRQERVSKHAHKYGIEDWMVVPEGFEMIIQQRKRRVRVFDLSPVAKKMPISLIEVAGSIEPKKTWAVAQVTLERVERPAKLAKKEAGNGGD